MTKRKLTLLGSHLATALIGAAMAASVLLYHWKDSLRGAVAMTDLTVSGYYGSLLEMRRDSASDVEYEIAIREYLNVLEKLLAREPKSEVYSTLAFDKTVTLARLALVQEARGLEAGSKELFAAAVAQCQSFRKGDCSETSIRGWAAYLDKRVAPVSSAK
jgi:hypothetical protein